ncbi:MAG: hypothetical protein LUD78_00475 [Clostridiales bacterium]|nr:hypothetical protein [Clostridiales bacterium]
MVQTPLFLLAVLYAVAGSCYLAGTLREILDINDLPLICCVRLMYAFVYGFLPCLIFWKEASGERNLAWYDYSADGLFHLYFLFFFSVLAYPLLLLFYRAVHRDGLAREDAHRAVREADLRCREDRHVLLCGAVTLAVGLVSLLLWTRAYGSVYQFILNASAIRSGKGSVSNPFAFMKYLAKAVEIAAFALLAAFLVNRPRGWDRVLHLALLALAGWAAVLYLLASDGRTVIAMSALAVIVLLLRHRRGEQIGGYLTAAALAAAAALVLTMSADAFTRYFRTGVWAARGTGILDAIVDEFQFVYSAQGYAIQAALSGSLELKFLDDLLIAVTRWIPSRFLPISLPDTVWAYNTANIYGSSASGTSPTDLLSTGIYYFGLAGVVIWPAVFGAAVGLMQNLLDRDRSYRVSPYYALLVGACIHAVSHNQLSSFVLALFPAFLYYLVSRCVAWLRREDP